MGHKNKKQSFNVTKFSGDVVPFDKKKLYNSLKKGGAKEDEIQKIIRYVMENMEEGKSTGKIYTEAFSLLKKLPNSSAARYKLKRSLMELGPSGFPFERYIAELFRHQGYKVKNNLIIKGKCVQHEIDVLAEKEQRSLFIECKFHNRQGLKSDVKIAMYFKARADDIRNGNGHQPAFSGSEIQGYLVTNTRFTEDAIVYSKCENVYLMSWDYPQNGSLKDLIELSGLYPITCLTTLKGREKSILLEKGIVMGKDLGANPQLLDQFNVSDYRRKNILNELNELCNA